VNQYKNTTGRGELLFGRGTSSGLLTDDDDSVRSGASRGSAATATTVGTNATGCTITTITSSSAGHTRSDSSGGGADGGNGNGNSGDRRSRFTVKGASYSIGKILSGKTKAAKQQLGITRLDRRKMHFKAPQKTRPRRGSRNSSRDSHSSSSSARNRDDSDNAVSVDDDSSNHDHDDACSEHSTSDNNTAAASGDILHVSSVGQKATKVNNTAVMEESQKSAVSASDHKDTAEDDHKVQRVPPRRPQRTISDSSDRETIEEVKMEDGPESGRQLPNRNSSFAEVDIDKIANGSDHPSNEKVDDDDDIDDEDDDDDDDAELLEEADRRSKFILKGGSHSIQKVLKGEARKKKGFSRFDRRSIKRAGEDDADDDDDGPAEPEVNQAESGLGESDKGEEAKTAVNAAVLDCLGESYSENVEIMDMGMDTDDGEEFAEEVARRSKFIAKGGSHSIKKVLAGEARSGGKKAVGPSRINRRNLTPRAIPTPAKGAGASKAAGAAVDETPTTTEEVKKQRQPPRTPMRTISVDSTDSQIEDEASRRSRFMLKGASHSIRNLLAGKAKKEKRLSRLDRSKLHFKHASDAVHYTEKEHKTPDEINRERLKAEEEIRERAREKKAARQMPKRPQRHLSTKNDNNDAEPSSANQDQSDSKLDVSASQHSQSKRDEEEDDSEILEEADKRSLMFKGGSHSIRNLFKGKGKKTKDDGGGGGIGRFNRRKMHFKKESEAVHYKDKPHLKPEEINARHQQEAERLRREENSPTPPKKTAAAPPSLPSRRISAETENDSNLDLGAEEVEQLQGEGGVEDSDPDLGDEDDEDMDADDDILEEANLRSNFMMKGGSYSIQKVLRGDAKKKEGVTRFDRRKMHFKHESEAIHCHDHDGEEKPAAEANSTAPAAARAPVPLSDDLDDSDELDDEDDADIIDEANKRSKFMMKGGSHSIQKVLRGEARKKEGVTRFNRRKMHFKKGEKDAPAAPAPQADAKNSAPRPPMRRPPSDDDLVKNSAADDDDDDKDKGSEEFDEEDLELLKEAESDPRRQMMLKGAGHSIRNIFSGKAKEKKATGLGMGRRVSQLKVNSSSVRGGLGDESENAEDPSERSMKSEGRKSAEVEDKSVDRRSKFSLKGASNSIRHLLKRKHGHKEGGQKAMDAEIERLQSEAKAEEDAGGDKGAKDSDDDMDDEDREIEEEASRRSNFMAKGASYSITKVLSGSARKKKDGVTRFDRRKMHFKKESEAVHSHDHDKDGDSKVGGVTAASPRSSTQDADAATSPKSESEILEPSPAKSVSDDLEDEDMDADDDIIEEADKRSKFMSKGGSYSIQKVLKGEARSKKGVSRFDRRKMHFKKESAAIHSHDHDGEKDESTPSDSPQPASQEGETSAPRAAPAALQKEPAKPANAKMPSRRVSDGEGLNDEDDEGARSEDKKVSPQKDGAQTDTSTEKLDDEIDAEEDAAEGGNRRKRFTLKGASHSIKKVLAGKARSSKKDSGVSRLDRRRIHLKSKSTPRADMDVPSKSPGKCFVRYDVY